MTRSRFTQVACATGIACLAQMLFGGVVAAETRDFFIKTVHFDGMASIHGDSNHAAETYSDQTLPTGNGLVRTPPNDDGAGRMRAFTFVSSQFAVNQGDDVRLHFVGTALRAQQRR